MNKKVLFTFATKERQFKSDFLCYNLIGDNMINGPKFNNIKTKEAFRSSLGIEETINTMQANLCQAINNNTPYAYYFAFILWCFYDYEKVTKNESYSIKGAYEYLKKQNFFFSLAHILENKNIKGAIGSNHITTKINLNSDGFLYEENYLDSTQSMDYYIPGLDTLMLMKTESLDGNKLSHPTVTEYGKILGEVFENTIINTEYYKNYRNFDKSVPKQVLLELSNTITIDLKNNIEIKDKLKNIFFNNKYIDLSDSLCLSKDLIIYINSKYEKDVIINSLRNVLFDYFSPRGNDYQFPEELNDIIKKWELVTARRYFTFGLSIIWKYMLPLIEEPISFNEWFNKSINTYKLDFDINRSVKETINFIDLDYKYREDIINRCRKDGFSEEKAISDGISLLLYVYKRISNRDDINTNHTYIVNSDWDTLPLYSYFDLVDKYLDKPLYVLIEYIMKNYLIMQNERTAYRKLVNENKDGYHFEKISDKYVLSRNYYFGLGNDRLIALAGILDQLDMLEGVNYER